METRLYLGNFCIEEITRSAKEDREKEQDRRLILRREFENRIRPRSSHRAGLYLGVEDGSTKGRQRED